MRITKKRAVVTIGLALSLASFGSKPSQAATLAMSEAEVKMYNFNYLTPDFIPSAIADTNTYTSSQDGRVTANADANALAFEPDSPNETYNISQSIVVGKGSNYSGLAQSFANVNITNFLIPKDTTLSFNFEAYLKLTTSIDTPESESASAYGIIDFQFWDQSGKPLDYFQIAANLSSLDDHDFLDYYNSEGITFDSLEKNKSFGGKEEEAFTVLKGTYSRKFTEDTFLTIQEAKYNDASVEVPEPVSSGGIALAGIIGWWMKRKQRRSHN
ncbi:hypothetical protein NIES2100_31480 [Calothrix sp. NIES-2100]|uniref:PEP-CTERM sorting domain-containing protein n=1 Tax=Calothrix sp. NIES-2100 TaxID=1954172 RepID=UPI000B6165A9|nr:hypothetical protein NIES2100_31480 [Calothrix sp. NIES-2100]